MSKLRGLAWTGAAAALAAATAIGLPGLARHVPWSVERALGRLGGTMAPGSVCQGDAPAAAAMQALIARIYPIDAQDRALPITIEVVRGDVVNAYATLGGHIYVFDGLVQQAQSPEELAGVLAHEIAHVRERHIIQGAIVNVLTFGGLRSMFPDGSADRAGAAHTLLSLRFSREQEAEADRDGLARLRSGQVDAVGFASFFIRAQQAAEPPPILSNHPSSVSRAELAAQAGTYPTRELLDAAPWQRVKHLCR